VHGFSFFEQVSTSSSVITRDPKAAKREISTALITGLVCDYSHKGADVAVGWDRKCPSQGIVL